MGHCIVHNCILFLTFYVNATGWSESAEPYNISSVLTKLPRKFLSLQIVMLTCALLLETMNQIDD